MSVSIGPLEAAIASLAASTTTAGELAVFYVASARICFTQAKEKLEALERGLLAREEALLATRRRLTQLAIAATEEKGGGK